MPSSRMPWISSPLMMGSAKSSRIDASPRLLPLELAALDRVLSTEYLTTFDQDTARLEFWK